MQQSLDAVLFYKVINVLCCTKKTAETVSADRNQYDIHEGNGGEYLLAQTKMFSKPNQLMLSSKPKQ